MKKFYVAIAALLALSGHGFAASAVNKDAEPRTLIVTEGGSKSELALAAARRWNFARLAVS